MNYPVLCVDNFYNNPEYVCNLASSIDRYKCEKIPVYRSFHLDTKAPEFYHKFVAKLFSLFGDIPSNFSGYRVGTFFQWMDKPVSTVDSTEMCGGIHRDHGHCKYAGVIYLTQNIGANSGTSVFSPIAPIVEDFNHTLREIDPIQYKQDKLKFESNFELSVDIKNTYNRLAGFDSQLWHRANNFPDIYSDMRLVQVFFVYDFGNMEKLPIERMKLIDL